ncbi:DHA2 family efflux MFS transporter permease subunit [Nocardia sp. 2]|uniref:DHA2 family efflux MFS transporter permease subunit n=1 Tax=Nocardia acididurans TaxID=2802282 RepID=A0ABS1LZ26_9NOCA|nr:DHA2 family efflux MFS transporter permease subunit [Nocardia acididurans]MBL1073471.1 DHA2 family efflux MFS transporter permease subunit [Nocardia acididurans]
MNATLAPARPARAADAPPLAAIATVVTLASIMTVLDLTIVNVALDSLAGAFDAPLSTIAWVATGYTLALAAVIPVTAWAMGRFGAKNLYLTAIVLFAVGSLLAGLAWNAQSLIAFRVLQGFGGGMIVPIGMTVMMRASTPERMGRTMALMGIPVLIGPLAGPVLGGWLVDQASWRWIFLINLPIAVFALIGIARVLPAETPQPGRTLDVPGLLMLSPGLAALIYGVATGGERADFSTPSVLVPTVLGAALVIGFVLRALRVRNPLLDLNLFAHSQFRTGVATLALFNSAYFGSMLLAPLYWQVVRGATATEAGVYGIPQVLATGITMQIAGRLVDRFPPRRIVLAGIVTAAAGFLLLTTQIQADTAYWRIALAGVVMGIGVGSTIMPTITTANRGLPPESVPAASTALSIVQQVASATGAAAISVLLSTAMVREADGSTLDSVRAAAEQRAALADGLADAFRGTYGWAVLVMVLAVLPALLLPRRSAAQPALGSH